MQIYTYREYRTLIAWLDEEEAMDNPSRTDLYIIRLTMEVVEMFSRKKSKGLNHYYLKPKKAGPKKTEKQKVEQSKKGWMSRLGLKRDGSRNRNRTPGGKVHR